MGAHKAVQTVILVLCCSAWSACGEAVDSVPAGRATARLACDLTVTVPTEAQFTVAQLRIHYDDAPGDFGPRGTYAECASLHPDATLFRGVVSCDDDCTIGESRIVQIQVGRGVSTEGLGLTTPSPIARCRFFATSEVDRGAFRVEAADASFVNEGPVGPVSIDAALDRVNCRPMDETTSSTTTTTESCAGTVCDAGEECIGGVCEHTGLYSVDFEVTEVVDRLVGALQFRANFDPELGEFVRPPGLIKVRCDLAGHINGFHSAGADDGELRVGVISGPGFALPGDVVSCSFLATGRAPEARDFEIETVDSSDVSIVAFDPKPRVIVGGVR